jgi:hypothetical protein
MNPRTYSLLLAALTVVAFLFVVAYQQYAMTHTAQVEQSQVAAVVAGYATTTLDQQAATAGCSVRGPYPDHACTPGAVFAEATPGIICVSGYSRSVRNVSVSTKKKLYAAYGLSYPEPRGNYELDHLIPLELGGSNEPANLFPEAAEPAPGFHEKDLVENYLHQEVCAQRLELHAAQVAIADDWLAVYNALSPATRDRLRQEFQSWAN